MEKVAYVNKYVS